MIAAGTMTRRHPHLTSGGLALLVHGVFLAALVFGVSWRVQPPEPVQAELWSSLPSPPQPVTPVQAPVPVAEPDPQEAEIALEKARKAQERKQELQRQAEEKARLDAEKRESARLEQQRKEQERQEQARQAQLRKQMEQDLARQMRDDMVRDEAQLTLLRERNRLTQQGRLIRDAQARIKSKIAGFIRLPQSIPGNPEAVFQVSLLPTGEVLKVALVKSSGHAAYDSEVERSILRASPLPLPPEREAAAAFRDGLILKFRPREDEP